MQDICDRLFDIARPYLTVRENQKHTEISYEFALKLLDRLGGRREVILPAIILHDVGWIAIPPEKHLQAFGPGEIDTELRKVHEIEGAKIAERLLKEVPLRREDCLEICRIIRDHDSGENPLTLEEMIVKDADKLSRYSHDFFNLGLRRFSLEPWQNWERLFRSVDKWLFTDYGRELARAELKKRKAC